MTLVRLYQKNGNPVRNEDAAFRYSDLLKDFFGEDNFSGSRVSPRTNILEMKDAFELEIALPGLSRKDIRMDVDKDILSISSRENEDSSNTGNYHRREFNYGNFCRSFQIPDSVSTDMITAKMENGILKVNLPLKEEAVDKGPREINIS